MSEIKKILRAWAVSSMLAKWVIIGAVSAAGAYVITGQGLHVVVSISQGVEDGK